MIDDFFTQESWNGIQEYTNSRGFSTYLQECCRLLVDAETGYWMPTIARLPQHDIRPMLQIVCWMVLWKRTFNHFVCYSRFLSKNNINTDWGRYHQKLSSQLITLKSQIFPIKNSNLQSSGLVGSDAKSSVFKTRQFWNLLSSHLRFWVSFNLISACTRANLQYFPKTRLSPPLRVSCSYGRDRLNFP